MQRIAKLFWIPLLAFCCFSSANPSKNQTPINIIVNNWSSQIVLAYITGEILDSVGYKTTYSEATTNEQWGSLSQGIDHVQIEVWEGTMSEMFNRMVESGGIIDAGSHDAKTREDWWYPSYVELVCPGLPDWQALKRCASLFSVDGSDVGEYVAGPWEKPEAARIRALELNFSVSTVSEADELWVALSHARKNKLPIVLFNWSPNWVEAVYDGKFVEFPNYSPECETDPEWGLNPDFHYDCGNPKNGWLKKAVWSKFPDLWPCAYDIIKNINFDNKSIAMLAAQVDFYKESHRDTAAKWVNENKPTWKKWIPSHCVAGS